MFKVHLPPTPKGWIQTIRCTPHPTNKTCEECEPSMIERIVAIESQIKEMLQRIKQIEDNARERDKSGL